MEGIYPYRKVKLFTLEKIVIEFLFFSVTFSQEKNYSSKWIYALLLKQDIHFLSFLKRTI